MRVRTGYACLLATLVLLAAAPRPTSANPIVDFTGGVMEPVASTVTYGYDFSVLTPFQVTGLGVFESLTRPLGSSHEVGLWDSTGTLLAYATVDGSDTIVASTDALGRWRTVPVTPISLGVGQYFAGVYYPVALAEDVLVLATTNTLPGITYGSARYEFGSFARPTNPWSNTLVGPAVLGSPVPEPGTLLLLGGGLVGLARARRRK